MKIKILKIDTITEEFHKLYEQFMEEILKSVGIKNIKKPKHQNRYDELIKENKGEYAKK